ncbi:hypothetical protein BDZ89DRAFT_1066591 [Hymenopellis radicata]|nr:hypothetical protein BDZ89DRAFT_1066591 [Hymenopellis radicata]
MVLIASAGLQTRLARLVFQVFDVFATAPMFIPSEELFAAFPDLQDEVEDEDNVGGEGVGV